MKKGASRPKTLIPHGTAGGYTNHRCRCERCREAWRVYNSGYAPTVISQRTWTLAARYVRDNMPDIWQQLSEQARQDFEERAS